MIFCFGKCRRPDASGFLFSQYVTKAALRARQSQTVRCMSFKLPPPGGVNLKQRAGEDLGQRVHHPARPVIASNSPGSTGASPGCFALLLRSGQRPFYFSTPLLFGVAQKNLTKKGEPFYSYKAGRTRIILTRDGILRQQGSE